MQPTKQPFCLDVDSEGLPMFVHLWDEGKEVPSKKNCKHD